MSVHSDGGHEQREVQGCPLMLLWRARLYGVVKARWSRLRVRISSLAQFSHFTITIEDTVNVHIHTRKLSLPSVHGHISDSHRLK